MKKLFWVLIALVALIVPAVTAAASDIPYGNEFDPERGAVSGFYPDRDKIPPNSSQYMVDFCFFNIPSGTTPAINTAMVTIDNDSTIFQRSGPVGGCGDHIDLIFIDFDFDGDAFPANDGWTGVAECKASLGGVCDKWWIKIDVLDVFAATAAEPGGYTQAHYNWNIQKLATHEAGHGLGFKHSSRPDLGCGPPNAYPYVFHYSAMGPDYPCPNFQGEPAYNTMRLHYNQVERCNLDWWLATGTQAGLYC